MLSALLVIAGLVWFALCAFAIHRVRRLHPELHEQLGRPSPTLRNSPQKGVNFLVDFLLARDPGIADDKLLISLRLVMQLYFLALVLAIFLLR